MRDIGIPHMADPDTGITTLYPLNRGQRQRALYLIRREPKSGRKLRLSEQHAKPLGKVM